MASPEDPYHEYGYKQERNRLVTIGSFLAVLFLFILAIIGAIQDGKEVVPPQSDLQ